MPIFSQMFRLYGLFTNMKGQEWPHEEGEMAVGIYMLPSHGAFGFVKKNILKLAKILKKDGFVKKTTPLGSIISNKIP